MLGGFVSGRRINSRHLVIEELVMEKRTAFAGRRRERGQTIILVAISLVSLLAMAALAIDVVTLYVARSEIQRAADAAALAGAKAMADSGITTLPSGDPNCSNAQTLAKTMAGAAINAVLPNNLVAGTAPSLNGSPSFSNFPAACPINDPEVTVSLQRTGLPTFFAHIWGRTAATVAASATAEAYNPANTSSFTPITPKGVKPWLVANRDPTLGSTTKFVDPATGNIEPGVILNPDFWLIADCQSGHNRCHLATNPPGAGIAPSPTPNVQYLPASVTPNAANVCPSSCGSGSDYQNSIQCADMNPYSCGGGGINAQWDMTDRINPIPPAIGSGDTTDGVECLIHAGAPGLDQGQDTINPVSWPSGPMQINPSGSANLLTTSRSIVSIPIIDVDTPGAFSAATGAVTVIGFLQAFVEQIDSNNNIQIKVMNVVGCSQTNNGAPAIVGGNSSSPIPVRLITPP
jgi:Flp pilus assembly protein TadG